MSEKPDVTMGEMTKTNEKSGRKVPKKIIWTIGAVAVAAIILIIPPSSRQVFRSYVSTFLTFHETHLPYEIIMSPGFFQGICPKRHLKHTVSNAFFQFCSTVPSVCPESLPPPRQVCSLSLPFSPVLPVSRGSLRQWRPPHR